MARNFFKAKSFVVILAALSLVSLPSAAQATGTVSVVLNAVQNSLQEALLKAMRPASVVAVEDIYSLTVTVTGISLKPDWEDDADKGGGHGGPGRNGIVIFEGAQDVDLISLTELSELFTSADIPAGKYKGICLKIESPRLRLKSDPNTEITNVKTTANGRLFARASFEILANQDNVVELTLTGLHLVKTWGKKHGQNKSGFTDFPRAEPPRGNPGHGGPRSVWYVLTPQLDVDVTVTPAETPPAP